ncbi:MAG: hypothetical protein LH478_07270 [Chitinophagaceae bacterium]|nr:hypothetical protein [Chitinophagaceae bacterium]
MKKLLFILMILPMESFAQAPEWVGGPLKNAQTLMGLIEQRLSIKFTDSSISPNRERMVFNDSSGRFVVKVELAKEVVQNINIEAPAYQINEFVNWFEKEFLEYAVSKNEKGIMFPESIVVTKPINNLRSYFYISMIKK